CPRCFEVGPEVAAQFPPESLSPALPSREGAHARTESIPGSEGVTPSQSDNSGPSKPHVDLAAAVALQLRRAGVTDIRPCSICSKTDPRFYSVRRQGRSLTHRTLSLITLSLP
ncbi:MAG: laccase domain-containing protein, partial [Muribaculaceae bacterium]|nr:laccase domain-containing protein [Muribaculaceae bacterium]